MMMEGNPEKSGDSSSMIDLFTTKQWFYLSCMTYIGIGYYFYKLIAYAKEAKRDRAALAALMVRYGKAMGIDTTKGD